MVLVALVAVMWLLALGLTFLARETKPDIERALDSGEEVRRSPEQDLLQADDETRIARGA